MMDEQLDGVRVVKKSEIRGRYFQTIFFVRLIMQGDQIGQSFAHWVIVYLG
jgi:hypothetical protein